MTRPNMRKELCVLVCIISMLVCSFCLAEDTSEGMGPTSGTCGSRLTWTLSDGVLTISGTGAMSNYTSNGGTPWEARKASITQVVVGSGVTSIGDYAFYGCSKLANVNLPSGLKTIGACAMYNCDSLVTIVIPNTVTSIGNSVFYDCDKLKNITLPTLSSGNR